MWTRQGQSQTHTVDVMKKNTSGSLMLALLILCSVATLWPATARAQVDADLVPLANFPAWTGEEEVFVATNRRVMRELKRR